MKHVRVRHDSEVHEGTLADETIPNRVFAK